MRILLVASPDDARVVQHCQVLLSAGWTVELATPRPYRGDAALDPAIRVHAPPARNQSGMRQAKDHAARRLRLAAARVSYRAADTLRARSGAEIAPGPFAMPPAGNPDSAHEPIERWLFALDLRPARDAPWLSRLIARRRPDAINSFGFADGIALTFAARETSPWTFPPWIVTLLSDDLGGAERDERFVGFVRKVFAGADGLLVENRRQFDLARTWGYVNDGVTVGPFGSGWPLPGWREPLRQGPSSQRRSIAVCGIQDAAGRAFVALRGIELTADALQVRGMRIVVFAASEDVTLAARALGLRAGLDITVLPPSSVQERLRVMGQARCTIALSTSVTADATLREAAVMGSLPIGAAIDRADPWPRDGKTALLVPADDPAAAAAALRRAMSDSSLVDRVVQRNDRDLEQGMDRETTVEAILDLYRRVASR